MIEVTKNIKYKVIIQLLYSAGLRRSELINPKLVDIDSKRMLIKVVGGKGRKDRETVLPDALAEHLRRQIRRVRAAHRKDFHVSPFIGMDARYEFRLSQPGPRLAVAIREFRDDRLMLVATQTGQRLHFTSAALLQQGLRVPVGGDVEHRREQ